MSFCAGNINKDYFPNHFERKTEGQFAVLKVGKECLNQLRSPFFTACGAVPLGDWCPNI